MTLSFSGALVFHVSSILWGNSKGFGRRKYELIWCHHMTTHSLVIHADLKGHLPDSGNASVLHSGLNRLERRTVGALYIMTRKAANHKE